MQIAKEKSLLDRETQKYKTLSQKHTYPGGVHQNPEDDWNSMMRNEVGEIGKWPGHAGQILQI